MEREECKARILYGQHLTNPADRITVCRDLNGIQAQYMSAALHALDIRADRAVERNFEDIAKELVKNWTIRGTVHVFAKEDLPLFLYKNRTHYLRPVDQMVADEYISLDRKQLLADYILECIDRGVDEREELKHLCYDYGMTESECESVFNSWGGTIRYLAEAGKICYKVQEKKAFTLCPIFTPMEEKAARLEMVRRYFTNFGPATIKDAAYFFGTTQRQIKEYLNLLPVTAAMVEGKERFWIENKQQDQPEIPDCIFLAGFDQLVMGYEKRESLFLPPEYMRGIFNLSGIVMPAILLGGNVTGRWKRQKDTLILTIFSALTVRERNVILEAAERQWGKMKKIVWEE